MEESKNVWLADFNIFYENHMILNMCRFHGYFAEPSPLTLAFSGSKETNAYGIFACFIMIRYDWLSTK